MKTMMLLTLLISLGYGPGAVHAEEQVSLLGSKVYSVTVSGASAESVIRMIAQKAGVPVQIEGALTDRVSYSFTDTTLENALARMATDIGFDYRMRDGVLHVSKGGKSASSRLRPHLLEMRFVDAEEINSRMQSVLKEGEVSHVDKRLNTIVLMASEDTLIRAKQFIELFDRMPQQILIEARIVETNNNFSRDLGFQLGDLSAAASSSSSTATATATATTTNPARSTFASMPAAGKNPRFAANIPFKIADSRFLDLRLIAAEEKGDAKTISRPRVVTINNMRAMINSGFVYNVKTLSTVQTSSTSGSGTGTSSVSGGLERVEAGLDLGVLPTILDQDKVRLIVDVNNSAPDTETAVDGIPGITRNSANTSLIVGNQDTAVIAGLIKNSKSKARSGVPFLSSIPVLGLLFRSDAESDRNNELMIFITPRILDRTPAESPEALAVSEIEKKK